MVCAHSSVIYLSIFSAGQPLPFTVDIAHLLRAEHRCQHGETSSVPWKRVCDCSTPRVTARVPHGGSTIQRGASIGSICSGSTMGNEA